jgi:hypothetical protein
MEGLLRSNGQKAVVVVATDGESSDGDIASAMTPLRVKSFFFELRFPSLMTLLYRIFQFGL